MTLKENLKKWLSEHGFPLEMEAASHFRIAGFDVRQGSVVLDEQEGKSREIDILAEDPDVYGSVEISCVIECKSSKAHPWVVFVADDVLSNYRNINAFCLSSPHAKEAMAKAFRAGGDMKELLPRGAACGYAFKQALGSTDHAYSASVSVLKACSVISSSVRDTPNAKHLKFAFPIIVVDAPLFECSRSDSGELVLREVQVSEFLYTAYVPEFAGCCIKVVKISALASVAEEYKITANILRNLFEADALFSAL